MPNSEGKFYVESRTLEIVRKLDNFLSKAQTPAYAVGGLVRDSLLKRATADIDVAVKGDALALAQAFARASGGSYVLLDAVNRIGRAVLSHAEVPKSKEGWSVDFSTINGEIEDDLARRDFTVDAMAIPLAELAKNYPNATLIDPFSGFRDLRAKVIRAVSKTSLTDDPARLLRGVRLVFELGFSLEAETESQIAENASLVSSVPGERVREEFLRLLDVPRSGEVLPYLDRLGLLSQVIPELEEGKGVTQPKEHYWNVFEHSLATVDAVDFLLNCGGWRYGRPEILTPAPWSDELGRHFAEEVSSGSTRRLLIKLAALLHDIAKPQTKAPDSTGRIRFLGHGSQGATAVVGIMERLRMSGRETRLVAIMVKYHLRPGQMRPDSEMPTHRAIYRFFRDTEGAGVDTLFLNLADHLATKGPALDLKRWREHCQFVADILREYRRQKETVKEEKLINGDDLIALFGMSPGPGIGRLLKKVREAQAAGEVRNRAEATHYVRKTLNSYSSAPAEGNAEEV